MIEVKKHSALYWKWRLFRSKILQIRSFFVYLFYALPRNYYLVKKYPFLRPSQGYGTDMEWWKPGYHYHYEETWLDDMPSGWRKAFGLQMCQEIQDVIDRDHITDYSVSQVKEKFGYLCWYDNGGNRAIQDIISKYEKISTQTCMFCGRPAEYVTRGWIGYYCGECIKSFRPGSYTGLHENH